MDWTRIENLTPADREAVSLALVKAGYTVRLKKEKVVNKTAIYLEFAKT